MVFSVVEAKDLGRQGHVFSIEEEDLLMMLKNRTKNLNEKVDSLSVQFKKECCSKIKMPTPINLSSASVYSVKYMDPTVCLEQDIKNHLGEVIISKGSCINPLEIIEHLDALLFFDADNTSQLEWAKKQNKLVKWVLTKGKPLEIEEQESYPVYFDQFGLLVEKFQIRYLPAKVSREGLKLKIEEIPLRDQNE